MKFLLLITLLFIFQFDITLAASQFINPAEENQTAAKWGLEKVLEYLFGTGIIPEDNLIAVILAWVRVALRLVGTLAFVAFIWAGFLYITAFGNEENAEKAKKVITWTVIGIIVILLSYTLTSALINATVNG